MYLHRLNIELRAEEIMIFKLPLKKASPLVSGLIDTITLRRMGMKIK